MPEAFLGEPIDPKFPDYAYAANALVRVYKTRGGTEGAANVFLGEWMKVLDDPVPGKGRVHVKYRGGEGYVKLADLTRRRHLEIYFLDVGQGDGILIQTPDDRRILIDGGPSDDAFEFIQNKYRLDKPDNYIDFDAVVATHSDTDHTGGLLKVLTSPKIAVKRFYHNGLFRRADKKKDPGPHQGDRITGLADRPKATDKPALAPFMKKLLKAVDKAEENLPVVIREMLAQERRVDAPAGGFVCQRLDAAHGFLPPYDKPGDPLAIQVLWPRATVENGETSYRWYGDAGKTVNGNSIVLQVRHGRQRILLTGDLNTASADDFLSLHPGQAGLPHPLEADVYKAAHHGSQDFSLPFLQAVTPNAAVISSGDDTHDSYGHPRAVLMGTITRYSHCAKPAVFCTELAACFTPLSAKQKKQFNAGAAQLYERSIQGIIHLRSNGAQLCLGTVYGRRAPDDKSANVLWKWDVWSAEE
jgi:beta-lactamase superfamily II metal-dependent hydrolase